MTGEKMFVAATTAEKRHPNKNGNFWWFIHQCTQTKRREFPHRTIMDNFPGQPGLELLSPNYATYETGFATDALCIRNEFVVDETCILRGQIITSTK